MIPVRDKTADLVEKCRKRLAEMFASWIILVKFLRRMKVETEAATFEMSKNVYRLGEKRWQRNMGDS